VLPVAVSGHNFNLSQLLVMNEPGIELSLRAGWYREQGRKKFTFLETSHAIKMREGVAVASTVINFNKTRCKAEDVPVIN
jgi:hypothetical protein